MQIQEAVRQVIVEPVLLKYLVDILAAARTWNTVSIGPSPRAGVNFVLAARTLAACRGRDFVTPDDIKAYIRFIADWRLRQLKLPEVYGVTENPLPWLQALLSGVEHANFFEARATEYSKAATKGAWHGAEGVWDSFDALMKRRTETAEA